MNLLCNNKLNYCFERIISIVVANRTTLICIFHRTEHSLNSTLLCMSTDLTIKRRLKVPNLTLITETKLFQVGANWSISYLTKRVLHTFDCNNFCLELLK